jgi:hypothetical protein
MNETNIHRRLDVLFFRLLNQVLRCVERRRTVRIDRRVTLGGRLQLELRLRLKSPRRRLTR